MKTIHFFAIGFTALSVSSCVFIDNIDGYSPKGDVKKTFEVKSFDELDLGNAFEINVKQGADFKLEAIGEQRDIDDLVISTSNGELKIRYNNALRIRRYRMQINIEMPTLKSIDFSGASVSKVAGFVVRDLEIDLSGASRAEIDSKIRNFDIDLSGASELELFSDAESMDVELSGASILNAFNTKTTDAILDISGASRAKVNVANRLKVKASGASSIRYRGTPKVETNLSGGSTVEKD
ncbi:MAG: DUF2807 domain-containing protein [Spirosomaceae bacterium]|jgi:hypothetical protein|nr:DUF2807 domain-containing protein [Spirosomataceae bacterium]